MNENIALQYDSSLASQCSFQFNDTTQSPLGEMYCLKDENNTCEDFYAENNVRWAKAIPGVGRGHLTSKLCVI